VGVGGNNCFVPPSSEFGGAGESSAGCLLTSGLRGLVVVLAIVVIGSLGLLAEGRDDGDADADGDSRAGLADTVRWDGRYVCGRTTRGISLQTRFVGSADGSGAPVDVRISYYDTPPTTVGGRVSGSRQGSTSARGALQNGVITFESTADPGSAESWEARSGRLRVSANGSRPDSISGRVRAEECSRLIAYQLD
jgi:hypothetical protein